MVSKALVLGAYHAKLLELANLGVELHLIVPPGWNRQDLEVREAVEYKIQVVPCFLPRYNHFHFYRTVIGRIEADLVHVDEEPWSLVTHQFMRACAREQKAAIFFTWQNINKSYPPPFSYFERFTFRHAVGGIAGNDEARRLLQDRGFAGPVALLPQFGVDPQVFFKRNARELRARLRVENQFVIGYVGRIVEEKGIADLVRALALLPSKCIIVLVGTGGFRTKAQQLAQQLGITNRIHWIPQVSSLDVPEYMNLFDVLVLPSRTTGHWKEQFGRVLIEAMASETPVIGSSSGEIPSVIGDAGLIFPEGDVAALAVAVRRIFASPSFAAQLGMKGRERVLDHFTHRQIAKGTLDFYQEVLAGGWPKSFTCELYGVSPG
jgi:glycosyltransferase involved in cell wall biosynthesis